MEVVNFGAKTFTYSVVKPRIWRAISKHQTPRLENDTCNTTLRLSESLSETLKVTYSNFDLSPELPKYPKASKMVVTTPFQVSLPHPPSAMSRASVIDPFPDTFRSADDL